MAVNDFRSRSPEEIYLVNLTNERFCANIPESVSVRTGNHIHLRNKVTSGGNSGIMIDLKICGSQIDHFMGKVKSEFNFRKSEESCQFVAIYEKSPDGYLTKVKTTA